MSPARTDPSVFWRWPALVIAALVVALIAIACWINWTNPHPVDFVSFWAAGRMALGGHGAAIYDIVAHRAVEQSAAPVTGLMPFPYPPPFLLIVAPFGALPFGPAFTAWIVITGAIFIAAARTVMPTRFALAHPAVLANGMIGQTGFLTAALLLAGTRLLDARPIVAGAMLGLVAIKPQLAVLIPLAMIAGRYWRALAAAGWSALGMTALASMMFGGSTYQAFFGMVPTYGAFLADGRWPWNELASPYAFARFAGVPMIAAAAVHAAIAIAAAAIVWRAWRLRWAHKAAILAAATILVPPYVMSYDAIVLALPLASLMLIDRHCWLIPLLWGLCLLPVLNNFGAVQAPNGLPLAAAIMLFMLWRDAERSRSGANGQIEAPETAHLL